MISWNSAYFIIWVINASHIVQISLLKGGVQPIFKKIYGTFVPIVQTNRRKDKAEKPLRHAINRATGRSCAGSSISTKFWAWIMYRST